jgi:hypothetical protein
MEDFKNADGNTTYYGLQPDKPTASWKYPTLKALYAHMNNKTIKILKIKKKMHLLHLAYQTS